MLTTIMDCKSSEDLIDVGVSLLQPKAIPELQREIIANKMVFSQEDYWQEDCLSTHTVEELLNKAKAENGNIKVLHLLQSIQKCCPVVASIVERLLQKTTR